MASLALRLTNEKRFYSNGFSELMGLYEEMCAIARSVQPATMSRSSVVESTVCWEWAATGYDFSNDDKEPETQLEVINGSNACDRGQLAKARSRTWNALKK
jgi:hypothetical protein